MAITVKINPSTVEVGTVKETITLQARKTLDGNIMIFDHEEMDIVVMPNKNKVVAFPKELVNDRVYAAQDRLFFFLRDHGVLELGTTQGGNIYGSMEARLGAPLREDLSAVNATLFSISKFIEKEKPYYAYDRVEANTVDRLTDPDEEDSTRLGEVPQEVEKGGMRPGWIRGPYGLNYMYRF